MLYPYKIAKIFKCKTSKFTKFSMFSTSDSPIPFPSKRTRKNKNLKDCLLPTIFLCTKSKTLIPPEYLKSKSRCEIVITASDLISKIRSDMGTAQNPHLFQKYSHSSTKSTIRNLQFPTLSLFHDIPYSKRATLHTSKK